MATSLFTKNDVGSIGKRIGRLLQQYQLRIAYAEYKAHLMDEERLKASAIGNAYREMQANISKKAWETYAKNLATKKSELEQAVREALICYNSKQRTIFWLYFIENKSTYEIEDEMRIDSRKVQRTIAAMKADMEMRFEQRLPKIGEVKSPKWSAPDLAKFLTENPSQGYIDAIQDMLDYGIIDLDTLEFDQDFQDYLEGGRP